ncbi:hypothetical protein M0R45_021262 [Rubus argutus]|uniref:MATH domain-containing protein n=1 Tax=Rubus argutus TaxID=59490 RepID=A0AAW1XD60_RUBAR
MARGDSDLGALTEALSSSQISKEKQPTDPSNGDDAGGVQITCFSELVHDTTTLHFQIMRLPKQIYAWIGCNSEKLGHLYAAAPTRPSAVSVTSILGGTSDNTGSGIARRLVSRTGLNIILACNIPKNSPMIEVCALSCTWVLRSYSDSRPSHFIKPLQAFSLLAEDSLASTNGKLELEDFGAGGYQWKLVLYPNGNKRENVEDHISLYLVMAGENSLLPGWEVCVDFRLFLLDQKLGKYLVLEDAFTKNFCFRHEMFGKAGFDKLISLKDFADASNGYLVDDTCVFGAEVFVCKETRPPKVCPSIIKCTSKTYKHAWKVWKFSSLGGQSYGEEFTAGGYKWKITLYPEGTSDAVGTHLGLYLKLADPKSLPPGTKISTNFCLRILDQIHQRHRRSYSSHCYTSSRHSWGWKRFITLDNFRAADRGFLSKDTCIIEAEVTINGIAMVPCSVSGGKNTIKQQEADVTVHRMVQGPALLSGSCIVFISVALVVSLTVLTKKYYS